MSDAAFQFRWRDADVTLPPEGEEVLIYHVLGDTSRHPKAIDIATRHGQRWTFPWADRPAASAPVYVTHWMPLPKTPN